jgi:formamidopyrimidine-DNA glycosylase
VPELPDITLYVERLRAKVQGQTLEKLRIASPFLLRSVTPSVSDLVGKPILSIERLGKRLVLGFPDELFAVIHLMISGRLRWREPGAKIPGQVGLAAFDFAPGTILFTEASKKKRASLHLVAGRMGLIAFDRGGLDVMRASPAEFAARLRAERHTVKRSLTDPTIFDGIGNAYSDEILHAAKMSPFRITTAIDDADAARLQEACTQVLTHATDVLRAEVGDGFPETVTAFRPEMAVHGKFGQPCPVCGQKVCRIVYAENEANYCATCQTEGRLLADRSLSRLLKDDWPKTLEELEERKAQRVPSPPGMSPPPPQPAPAPSADAAPAKPAAATAAKAKAPRAKAAPRKKPSPS